MEKHHKQALAALAMWVPFTIGFLVEALLVVPTSIVLFALTGNEKLKNRVYRSGKAIDQLCNTAWFFNGYPKETISSHCGRILLKYGEDCAPWQAKAVKKLTDLGEQDHVYKSIEEPFIGLPTGLE